MPIDRRAFLAYGTGTALGLFVQDPSGRSRAIAGPVMGGSLRTDRVERFALPLVVPKAMPRSGPNAYRIAARQQRRQMLPPPFGRTPLWCYGAEGHDDSFASPAATIEATRGTPIEITWINDLTTAERRFRPHLLPVDPTLHWANPGGRRDTRPTFTTTPGPYRGPVPLVTHVHGMEAVEDWSDGYPEAWVLPDAVDLPEGVAPVGTWYDFFWAKSGRGDWGAGRVTFRYPNSQRPGMLWYHDHTLGLTRLNVYAGLAGLYLIRSDDPADQPTVFGSGTAAVLPAGAFEIPLAIVDRSFNADGSLFYPDSRRLFDGYAGPFIPTSEVSPIWVPEFFGNVMVVNGRAWPRCEVEPRRYRLRILNACNSRVLILRFADPKVEVWQIGTEGGFLRAPVKLRDVLLAPAERADLIVDFSRLAPGSRVTLRNLGPDAPYKGAPDEDPAERRSTGQVMQVRVVAATGPDATTPPARLALPPIAPLPEPVRTRSLALVEQMAPSRKGEVPHETALATFDPGLGRDRGVTLRHWADPVTENPAAGDTEDWAFHNLTGDAHPMHVHDVLFQVVDRRALDDETGRPEGPAHPPRPEEDGWKDTVIARPGEVTRVRMRFSKPGQFVWHCHMVEHEDNEMMRPFRVGPEQPGEPQDHGAPKT
ncbi:multicopper oxidase family protein [Rhodoplanes azumiensis]|uniref:Multicopper oxidase family protein n=1 Tax=Rhodoplanes azumiensis TaxID=1897628 RepID=A0ABW5AP89_9BRAD